MTTQPTDRGPTGPSSRRRLRHLFALVFALIIAVGLVNGCGDDTSSDDSATSATDDGSDDAPVASDDEEALIDASDELITVCRGRDHNRLRDLSGAGIQDRLRDQDMDKIFGVDVEALDLVDREIVIDGDTATVTATIEIVIDGETSEVERVWSYERADDGTWVLNDVPDCLFR